MRRISRRQPALATVVLALIASGCSHEAPTSTSSLDSTAALAQSDNGIRSTSGYDVVLAFDVATAAQGPIELGTPVTFTASITSRFDVSDVEVAIRAPEVVSAIATGWDHGFRTLPGKIPASVHVVKPFQHGERANFATTLTFESPGFYRLVVSASARPSSPGTEASAVQWTTHDEVWVYVDSLGGRLTSRFEASEIPAHAIKEAGPIRTLRGAHSTGRPGAAGLANLISGDGYDYYVARYYDSDSAAYVPVPGATYEFRYWRNVLGEDEMFDSGIGSSGANGLIAIQCDNLMEGEWYDFFIIGLEDSNVKMINTPSIMGGAGGAGGRTADNT